MFGLKNQMMRSKRFNRTPTLEKDTLDAFMQEVSDSVNLFAQQKGYCGEDGVDGENDLLKLKNKWGIATGHHIGEVLGKLAEYTRKPRRVILIKIAGYMYLEWKNCKD